ncbi:MAG: aminotransferase class V-fold PLP-dependent enzyme [Candidatus Eremiobacteraeota bacterium]|nr:aminotransferase class V-fold PLP-dependent enzyme [Candidatus Eremiobacteraeota bacterium]
MLDPSDWNDFRADCHRAVDSLVDYLAGIGDRPVWQRVPQEVKEALHEPLPTDGMPFGNVYDRFKQLILPYPTGNISPRFFGWVHGSGTAVGALADFAASTMNSNVGGRDHGAVYVERQVIAWFCELFGFGEGASGILLSGTSLANFVAILVARTARMGHDVRERGLDQRTQTLVGYASAATHSCVRKAFEMAGLGSAALRVLPIDAEHRIDLEALEAAIERDETHGLLPFIIVGSAGTVDVGAFDPLEKLAAIAKAHKLWFHVDGAFGAMTMLSDRLRDRVRGIEQADSIAFDFHKWLHVPYDAACVLVRDGAMHRQTFASEGPYITRMERGLAAGEPWFADYGPDLSRSFRALKIWFTLKHFGTHRLARAIERNCEQAQLLGKLIEESADFELAAPVGLNIVCFRRRGSAQSQDAVNDEIAIKVQLSGRAVISSTTVGGRRALRACFTNQRTTEKDVHELFDAVTDAARA